MIFAIYADNFRVFTSCQPQRGLLKQFIQDNPRDKFVFYLHKKFEADETITTFFEGLSNSDNWSFVFLRTPQKISRLKQLFGIASPNLPLGADFYISPDIETFGRHCRPVINFLADMTVFDDTRHTSLSKFNSWFRRVCISRMANRTDLILAVSQFTKSRFEYHFPHARNKVKVFYNGIDSQWFDQIKALKENKHDPYWVWMGAGYSSRKNIDRLLQAYNELRRDSRKPVPNLRMVGLDLDSIEVIRQKGHELNIQQFLILESKVPLIKLIEIVDLSAGLVFPSIYEGFGLPVVEAFSRGKAVLTSNVSSLPEISNGLGMLCDPTDVDSIRVGLSSMLDIMEDDEFAVARRTWAKQFNYRTASAMLYEILDELK